MQNKLFLKAADICELLEVKQTSAYLVPVSYTHLDVYKRQKLLLLCSSRAFSLVFLRRFPFCTFMPSCSPSLSICRFSC